MSLVRLGASTITPLIEIEQTYPAMLTAIDHAESTLHFANFCVAPGVAFERFYGPLLAAAQRGVRVRLLLDAHGSSHLDPARMARLTTAGAQLMWFRPLQWHHPLIYNHRLHKKLLIIDGRIGFSGGVGIGEFWLGDPRYPTKWRDTHFRFEGPIVGELENGFIQSWNDWSSDQLPAAPELNDLAITTVNSRHSGQKEMPIATHLRKLIANAHHTIRITTAYFGPPAWMRRTLTEVSRRGVNVQVLCNGPYGTHAHAIASGRHLYGPLLRQGIHIYEYQPTKMHAKITLIDDELTSIGSANLNSRSLHYDEEFNLTITSQALNRQLTEDFERDLEQAKKITAEQWAKRPLGDQLSQAAWSLGRYLF